ncbi:MAG: hypothetical protein QM811_07045 [Pirellulales bacterium]
MSAIKDEFYSDSNRIGQIVYNGVVLNPTLQYKLQSRMVKDDSQRVRKHTEYTVSGTFIVWGEDGSQYTENIMSQRMQTIKERLQQPGRELRILDIGFGDLVVNSKVGNVTTDPLTTRQLPAVAAGVRLYKDVNFGPNPNVMDFRPFSAVGWEVIWSCTFSIVETSQATTGNPLLTLNYTTEFEYDHRGQTTIRVAGHYELPVSAADYVTTGGSSSLAPKTDEFWDKLRFKVPKDFKVGPRGHTNNAAKNRVDFYYTIIELEGEPFPPGIVDGDIDEDWENAEANSFSGWNGTISGWLEIAKDQNPTVAARRFLNIYLNRLTAIRSAIAKSSSDNKYKAYVLPTRFSFGCKRFTKRYNFAASYAVLGCIPDFMNASGIFKQLGTDYDQWVASVKLPWDNRGIAGATPTVEVIVSEGNNLAAAGYDIDFKTKAVTVGEAERYLTFDADGITAENSFLGYQNRVLAVRRATYNNHKFAQSPGKSVDLTAFGSTQEQPTTTSGSANGGKLYDNLGPVAGAVGNSIDAVTGAIGAFVARATTNATNSNVKADVLEYSGTPDDFLVMTGKTLRIKYQPEIPKILAVGEVEPELVAEAVQAPLVIGMVGDTKIYYAAWQKIYKLPGGYKSTAINPTSSPDWACTKPFG